METDFGRTASLPRGGGLAAAGRACSAVAGLLLIHAAFGAPSTSLGGSSGLLWKSGQHARDRMRSGDLDKVGEPKGGAGKRLACSRACSRRLIVVCRIADFLLGDVIIYRRGRHVRGEEAVEGGEPTNGRQVGREGEEKLGGNKSRVGAQGMCLSNKLALPDKDPEIF